MVTIKDIAKAAGVSTATVSLALNNRAMVNEDTRVRIQQLAQGMGYTPNAMAQGLIARKTKIVGVILPNINIPFFSVVMQHLEDLLRSNEYHVMFGISNDDVYLEEELVKKFCSHHLDGIIIGIGNKKIERANYFKYLEKNHIPFIFINNRYSEVKANYVVCDLEDGMYQATSYLLESGHRNIVFMAGQRNDYPSTSRINGFLHAFESFDLECKASNIIECGKNYSFDDAYRKTAEIISSSSRLPDAIITSNDYMALGVLKVLKENGIKVPDEVSIIGYDDVLFSTITEMNLTTVQIPIKEMMERAVQILISSITDKSSIIHQLIMKPSLVIRNSVKAKNQ